MPEGIINIWVWQWLWVLLYIFLFLVFVFLPWERMLALCRDVNQLGRRVILTARKKWMEAKCPVNNYFWCKALQRWPNCDLVIMRAVPFSLCHGSFLNTLLLLLLILHISHGPIHLYLHVYARSAQFKKTNPQKNPTHFLTPLEMSRLLSWEWRET